MPTSKIAVFTAISGSKDKLREDQNTVGADFYAFLEEDPKSDIWTFKEFDEFYTDPVRTAKKPKILPHLYFPEYEYSLWIDGCTSLKVPAETLVEKYLKDSDIALFPHYMRDCIYDEGFVCGSIGKDDPDVISKQLARYYARDKYPRNNGLWECGLILRRHTPQIQRLNELWWEEIDYGSRRDQISFPYVLWGLGIKPTAMEGTQWVNKYTDRGVHNYD